MKEQGAKGTKGTLVQIGYLLHFLSDALTVEKEGMLSHGRRKLPIRDLQKNSTCAVVGV